MIKRAIDIMISMVGLIILFPVLVGIFVLIRLSMGAPVFFRQKRPGLNENPFEMIKFRTMLSETSRSGRTLTDSERVTGLGRFLRSFSLDELPELWNVLKGEMSLVGPRPLLMQYLPLYSQRQRKRHQMRPGLTGWAQVNGRNGIGWEEKFELDVWYVENQSLWLDFQILLKTMGKVARREGILAEGEVMVEAFSGNASNSIDPEGTRGDDSNKESRMPAQMGSPVE